MAQADRQRWNERYSDDERPSLAPAAFVLEALEPLASRGRALDLACGAGRHSVALAKLGFDVTGVDVSDVALEQAARLAEREGVSVELRRVDLDAGWCLGSGWDVIVVYHYLDRALLGRVAEYLGPGGVLIFCQPTATNAERHARPSRRFLLDDGEATTLLVGLEIVSCEERWFDNGRHEARVVARKPLDGFGSTEDA